MKRKFLLVLFAFASVMVSAQVTWNVKAGMNISKITGDAETDAKIGFKVGAGMEYAFNKTWALQPSLLFTTKGATASEEGIDMTVNAMYLELPIMMAARFAVSDKTNIVVSAGPYLAYGIAGKTSASEDGVEVSVDTFGEATKDDIALGMKRFDAGLGVGVGVEFGKIVVGLDSQFGLVDVMDGGSSKNLNVSIGVAYKF